MRLGLSTGCIYKWCEGNDHEIEVLKRLDMNALEINYAQVTELRRSVSEKHVDFLKGLDYLSLHAPFYWDAKDTMTYRHDDRTIRTLSMLEREVRRLDADSVVLHPQIVEDFSVFEDFELPLLLENLPYNDVDYMVNQFEEHPEYGMVLDTAHALANSPETLDLMVGRFSGRIRQVHLSDRRFDPRYGQVKDHQSISSCADLSIFDEVVRLECPFILEIELDDVNSVAEESAFAKSFLDTTSRK